MSVGDAARAAVNALELVDDQDDEATVTGMTSLADDRRTIYAAYEKGNTGLQLQSGSEVLSVSCESENGPFEHIVVVTEGVAAAVIVTDKITYDDVPVSQLVEYRFGEDGR